MQVGPCIPVEIQLKRLKLAQLLGQFGVFLTWGARNRARRSVRYCYDSLDMVLRMARAADGAAIDGVPSRGRYYHRDFMNDFIRPYHIPLVIIHT
jgi:hypothetical protein